MCIYIYIYIHIHWLQRHHFSEGLAQTESLILRGTNLMSIGDFPESLSQAILLGRFLVWRLGVHSLSPKGGIRKGGIRPTNDYLKKSRSRLSRPKVTYFPDPPFGIPPKFESRNLSSDESRQGGRL